jgi:hypothetical protein
MQKIKIKTPKVKPIYPSEDTLHKACIQWFDIQYPKLRNTRHHSPNENSMGNRGTIINYNKKQTSIGRVAGWPDFELYYNGKVLLVEFKTIIGRLSDNQKIVFADLQLQGFPVYTIRTFEEFQVLINNFIQKYCAKKEDQETNLP